MAGSQFEQDGRSDVVGQVAGDQERLARRGCGCGEVEGQYILLDDSDAVCGVLGAQVCGHGRVELDGQDMAGVGRQGSCDGALAGADFNDGAAGKVAEGSGDSLNRRCVFKEILAELGFDGHELL